MHPTTEPPFRGALGRGVLLSLLLASAVGCGIVAETARMPVRAANSLVSPSKESRLDVASLQVELQRFGDEYSSRTIAALSEYARASGSLTASNQALVWKLSVASACVSIASGDNPLANLLDFIALATQVRKTLERELPQAPEAHALQSWRDASVALEAHAWSIAERTLSPAHREELRGLVEEWWVANAGSRLGFFARPDRFTSLSRRTGGEDRKPGSLFALVGLDPTAGLDPAVREVTRTRLFAERALYVAQRMPLLMRWQVEILTAQIVGDPRIEGVLTNAATLGGSADRLSRAAELVGTSVAGWPQHLASERQAMIEALEEQEGRLRELSAEVRSTLLAGDQMLVSLDTAVRSFDGLMERFGVGEGETNQAPSAAAGAPPFNILDYARTAQEIAGMADRLDALLRDAVATLEAPAWKERLAEVDAVTARARTEAKSVLNHAFLLAAGLLVLAFVLASLYRRWGRTSGEAAGRGQRV